jgi:hypothetical protein
VPPDESPQVMKKIKKEEGSPTTWDGCVSLYRYTSLNNILFP